MNIAFYSGSAFTLPLFEYLHAHYTLTEIVTKPDTIHRGKTTSSFYKQVGKKYGIPVQQPDVLNSFQPLSSDLAVIASYGKIIPNTILQSYTYGCINWHPSLLPLLRGPTPLQTAIAEQYRETGVTWILMNERMDAGDILIQQSTHILPAETTEQLAQRTIELGISLFESALENLLSNKRVQQNNDHATYTKILSKQDALCDHTLMRADQIAAHVRAYHLFPQTRVTIQGNTVRINSCTLETNVPGYDLVCKDSTHLIITSITDSQGREYTGTHIRNFFDQLG